MRNLRLDAPGWLWVAVAAWALLCALVAVLGFGGRYRLLPDDASSAPALPAVAAASPASTMGPLEDFAAATKRPLFYADRKPIAAHLPGQSATAQPLDAILTSVILTPDLNLAIVQDAKTHASYRARLGQSLDGPYSDWKLVTLNPRNAVFESSQGQTSLDLRVFNGQGGEPPTRMGLTPEVVAGGALGQALPPNVIDVANPGAVPQPPMLPQGPNPDARQMERIRQRIEQRRREAQSASDAASSPNQNR